jgi:ribosomal protein L4
VNDNFASPRATFRIVDVLPVQGINVYDILRRNTLVLTKAAVVRAGGALQMSSNPNYDVIVSR